MLCSHLKEFHEYVRRNKIRLSSMDLIHIVCEVCNTEETCPSVPEEYYDDYRKERHKKRESQKDRKEPA